MGFAVYRITVYVSLMLLFFEQFNIAIGKRKRNVYHLFMTAVAIIANIGFIMLMNATDVDTALVANKFTYVGGCILPVIVLKMGQELCRVKFRRWEYTFVAVFAFLVLAMAWTPGHFDWYYSSVELEIRNGVTILHKEYAFLHNFYYIYLGLYMLLALKLFITAIMSRRKFRNVTAVVYVCVWVLAIVVYFGERILKSPVSFVPMAIAIAVTVFSIQFRRVSILEMNPSLLNIGELENENAYIVIDANDRVTVINDKALRMFPELRGFGIDFNLKSKTNTIFYLKLFGAFVEDRKLEVNKATINGITYKVEKRLINRSSNKVTGGWIYRITDVSEEERYNEMLIDYRGKLEKDVAERTERLEELRRSIISGIASMIEGRDLSTGEHVRRTSDIIKIFTKKLLETEFITDETYLRRLAIASTMHDLGKISVDDAVLRKQGKYTTEEYNVMKGHAANGAVIVRKLLTGIVEEDFVALAENVAHYHHEKWDGTGYPNGLRGKDIPLEARIMAVADVFDALVSKRCYKDAYSYDTAFEIIESSIGSHFDPDLGRIFLTARSEIEELYNGYSRESLGMTQEVRV